MPAILDELNTATLAALRNTAILAAIFTLLPLLARACNSVPPWWRKPDLSTDLCWVFVPRLFNQFAGQCLLVTGLVACYGMSDPVQVTIFLRQGYGPLAGFGFWPQVMLYLLGSDLAMYGTHRLLHGSRLWRFHAVHHCSRHLDWISAERFHPLDKLLHASLSDVVMLLLGIPPHVVLWMTPFNVGTSSLAHANLDWSFGPLRYVFASPVFHRWHHTSLSRGGSSNFAGTFPFLDLLFGTFYMPPGQKPDDYGLSDAGYPSGFAGQLLQPCVPRRFSATSHPE